MDKKYFLKVVDKDENILYFEENPIGNENNNVNGNSNGNVDRNNNKDANRNNNAIVGSNNKNFVGVIKNVNNKVAARSNNYDLDFPAIGSNNQNVTRNNNVRSNNKNVTGNDICNSNRNVIEDNNIGSNDQNVLEINASGNDNKKSGDLTTSIKFREPDTINNVPENGVVYKKKDEEDYFTGKNKKSKKRGKK